MSETQLGAYQRVLRKQTAHIEELKAALEPFARNARAKSLMEALGHIEREHLLNARVALDKDVSL